jgi:hypothetical protein
LRQVDVSEIIVDEGDEPNGVVDFRDANGLPGKDGWEIDLLAVRADAAAGGDENLSIVEGIAELQKAP